MRPDCNDSMEEIGRDQSSYISFWEVRVSLLKNRIAGGTHSHAFCRPFVPHRHICFWCVLCFAWPKWGLSILRSVLKLGKLEYTHPSQRKSSKCWPGSFRCTNSSSAISSKTSASAEKGCTTYTPLVWWAHPTQKRCRPGKEVESWENLRRTIWVLFITDYLTIFVMFP